MAQHTQSRRPGMTLVELVVVIVIIATLAALTALYFPRYQDKEMVARGADQLQGLLLNARQRARRDGLPTGLLLVPAVDPPTKSPRLNQGQPYVNEIHYIQQPEDFSQGVYVGPAGGNSPNVAAFAFPPATPPVNFNNLGGITILPGDYLEIYGGGLLRRIQSVQPTTLTLEPNTTPLPALPSPPPGFAPGPGSLDDGSKPNARTNYRIIAQPRELPGEQKIFLPENIGIDLNPDNPVNPLVDPSANPPRRPMSRNLPTRSGQIEILFGPSGALVGMGTPSGKVILWVRDLTRDNTRPGELLAGSGTLITIDPRTGFIAAHPAVNSADPYQFTRDARSSGL